MRGNHTGLTQRAVLSVTGEDRRTFLQGLVSNDVEKLVPVGPGAGMAIHTAFLTPQGKFLHEFFILEQGERLLIDAEAERIEDLRKRLSMYRLRSKVQIATAPEFVVFAAWGDSAAATLGLGDEAGCARAFGSGFAFVDPRLAQGGCRILLPAAEAGLLDQAGLVAAGFPAWDEFRLALGLADGSRDLAVDKALLLENGFEEWGSVDFKKGCYMGQELTARTKYRALIKKRLLPVEIDGPAPEPGTAIMLGPDEAGEMRSASGRHGLAVIRLEALAKAEQESRPLEAGQARLVPRPAAWMNLPSVE